MDSGWLTRLLTLTLTESLAVGWWPVVVAGVCGHTTGVCGCFERPKAEGFVLSHCECLWHLAAVCHRPRRAFHLPQRHLAAADGGCWCGG